MATPFDDKITLWHWKGDVVSEETIDEVALTLKRRAPHATGIMIKTSDGVYWNGVYDGDRDLAVDGPASIDKWVQTLAKHNLELHTWAVVRGFTDTLDEEANRIIDACNRPGVKSMTLDVEPYEGYWEGPRQNVYGLMSRVRRRIPAEFHIALGVDPRPQHYEGIFPGEWWPFVQSVILYVYWGEFGVSPEYALQQAFDTWSGYNKPLYPALQTYAPANEVDEARRLSVRNYGAGGLTYWRFGVINAAQFEAINHPLDEVGPPPEGGHFGQVITVTPGLPGYNDGVHQGSNDGVWATFQGRVGQVKYRETQRQASTVWARWDPRLVHKGVYEIGAFVPRIHATTKNARYKIHGANGVPGETLAVVDQVNHFDYYVSLGVFNFDPEDEPTAGVVYLNDLTGELPAKEIAFASLRWRQIIGALPVTRYIADGFDAPIGSYGERASADVWPGDWFDATGFNVLYRTGTSAEAYHTGTDLNLNEPHFDADAHSDVLAPASGVVTFAGRIAGWGNVIVIRHDPLLFDGKTYYSRHGHVEEVKVSVGQRVSRGQPIAKVGNAEGIFAYHLHYDISPTRILETEPWHWPKLDREELLKHYIDPKAFTEKHRPPMR